MKAIINVCLRCKEPYPFIHRDHRHFCQSCVRYCGVCKQWGTINNFDAESTICKDCEPEDPETVRLRNLVQGMING